MPLQNFSILSYGYQNPLWCAPNVAISVNPVPGFSAVSYSLTGSLPAGLSFNTTTGNISGTPTAVTPTATLVITATLANSSTSSVTMPITVSNEPPQAIVANTASALGLVDSKLVAQTNWLASAEQTINNNNAIGKYTASLILTDYISFMWVYNYMTSLNYSVTNLTPAQDDYQFISYFGQPQAFSGSLSPFNQNFEDFTQPTNLVRSRPVRKVLISWSPFMGWSSLPWTIPPFYGPY
jgi:hypothetical protein